MRVGRGEGEDRGSCGWLFVLLRPFRGPEVASLSVSLGSSPPAQLSSLFQGRKAFGGSGTSVSQLPLSSRGPQVPSTQPLCASFSSRVKWGSCSSWRPGCWRAPAWRWASCYCPERLCARKPGRRRAGEPLPPGRTDAFYHLTCKIGFRPAVCPRSALRPSELDSCPICQRSVLRGYAASFSALPSNRARTSLIRDPSASPLTGALKLRYVGS